MSSGFDPRGTQTSVNVKSVKTVGRTDMLARSRRQPNSGAACDSAADGATALADDGGAGWRATVSRVVQTARKLAAANMAGADDAGSDEAPLVSDGDPDDCSAELLPSLDAVLREQAPEIGSEADDAGPKPAERAQLRDALEATIQAEIIPRLMLTHQIGVGADRLFKSVRSTEGDQSYSGEVIRFAELLWREGSAAALEAIHTLRERGWSLDEVYLDLLAPTARRYGMFWVSDAMSFADVTIGLSRLHFILRALGGPPGGLAPSFDGDRRVLFAPMPGEQHTFGVCMLAEFFRRAGWEVAEAAPQSAEELIDMAERGRYSIVGLSIAHDSRLEPLAATMRDLRRLGPVGPKGAMVGGRVFSARPDLALRIGADATASNALQAVDQAARLIDAVKRDC